MAQAIAAISIKSHLAPIQTPTVTMSWIAGVRVNNRVTDVDNEARP